VLKARFKSKVLDFPPAPQVFVSFVGGEYGLSRVDSKVRSLQSQTVPKHDIGREKAGSGREGREK
jgi:hypothetical protein